MALTQVPAAQTGGMTLLSTTALSGTSTDITGISQSYTNLFIYIPRLTFNASADLAFLTGDTTFSATFYLNRIANGTTTFQDGIGQIRSGISGTDVQGIAILINGYSQSNRKTGYATVHTQAGGLSTINFADWNSTGGIERIRFTSVAGTSTFSSGTVSIYGVK